MSKEDQQLMRDWLEPYRPVHQRTVRCPSTCAPTNSKVHQRTVSALPPSVSTSIPGPFLKLGKGNALALAGHMTLRISGCKNILISVVSVSVCINNKSAM